MGGAISNGRGRSESDSTCKEREKEGRGMGSRKGTRKGEGKKGKKLL
jgi:hypothetical protein